MAGWFAKDYECHEPACDGRYTLVLEDDRASEYDWLEGTPYCQRHSPPVQMFEVDNSLRRLIDPGYVRRD